MSESCDVLIAHGEGADGIVMVHAAGSGPKALDRLAVRLASSGWRTTAPLLRRDGASVVAGDVPFADAVSLVEDMVGRIQGRRMLFGHSMGGLVVIKALLAGVKANAVVLYEPIVLDLLDPADSGDAQALDWDRGHIDAFRRNVAAGDPEAGVARFVEAFGGGVRWGEVPGPVRADLVRNAASLLADAEATHRARIDAAGLASLAMPVLVLEGDRSPPALGRMCRRFGERLGHAERGVIAGASHMGPVNAPDAVCSSIVAFTARLGWPSAASPSQTRTVSKSEA